MNHNTSVYHYLVGRAEILFVLVYLEACLVFTIDAVDGGREESQSLQQHTYLLPLLASFLFGI